MKWRMMLVGLAAVCLSPTYGFSEEAVVPPPASPAPLYTTAVLDFESKEKDLGRQVGTLLATELTSLGVALVERADLDKVLSEIELGMSGTVSPETAAKVGYLTGAKVIVTGQAFVAANEMVLTAKVFGTETGVILGHTEKVPARDTHVAAVKKLAPQIALILKEKESVLVAKAAPVVDEMPGLLKAVEGKKLPTVSVSIKEGHATRLALDPAAETEIEYTLKSVGFELVDPAATTMPADIDITGEAFSEFGLQKGNLFSCKGRLEVKAVEHATGKIIAVDRETQTAVELSELMAGKTALQRAAAAVGKRLVPKLSDWKKA